MSAQEGGLRWVLLGTGRAGRSRRDAIALDPRQRLVAEVGARAGEAALLAALATPGADAAVISTANPSHPALVARAIAQGLHVLVEFPLAPDAATGEALWQQADAAGVVLHVGWIGMLSPTFVALRRQRGAIRTLELALAGESYRWVADAIAVGHVGSLCVARLAQACVLVGPITVEAIDSTRGIDAAGVPWSDVRVRLRGADGQAVALHERRRAGATRQSSIRARDGAGADLGQERIAAARLGLFAIDTAAFALRVASGDAAGRYVDDRAVSIEAARIADAIDAATVIVETPPPDVA